MAEYRSRKLLSFRHTCGSRLLTDPFRRTGIEPLERRDLLSVAPTLAPISDVTVLSGAPLHIALVGSDPDGGPVTYSATSDNAELTTFIPTGNRNLEISVQGYAEDMILELFEGRAPDTTDHIIALAQAGDYDPNSFHRIIDNFMIQGGAGAGSGDEIDDVFHPDLQHTSGGILSMAKWRDDTNNSQFFITEGPTRWLDFEHSIFGFLVDGEDVRESLSTKTSAVIDSVAVSDDLNNNYAVLTLKAAEGVTGSADVTVTVDDGVDPPTQQAFHVTITPDTSNGNPYLLDVPDIHTSRGIPVGFDLNGFDVEGDPVYFGAWSRGDWIFPEDPRIAIDLDTVTGQGVVTPLSTLAPGVHGILVGANPWDNGSDPQSLGDQYNYLDVDPDVYDVPASTPWSWDDPPLGRGTMPFWDFQFIPLLVDPSPPTGLDLLNSVDRNGDEVTNANNTLGNELRFRVTGLTDGAEVTVFADGVQVGQSTAAGDSLVIVTTAGIPLIDGTHQFTAQQALRGEPLAIGNRNETVDLESGLSAPLDVTIDSTAPAFTSVPITGAVEGQQYVYDAQTNEEAGGGMEYRLDTSPAGMTIDPATGVVTWTPQSDQGPVESVVVRAVDPAGNITDQAFDILITDAPQIDPIIDQVVAEHAPVNFIVRASDADTPLVFGLKPGAPSGSTIDPATGEFRWTPSEAQGPGDYDFTVSVTDATGVQATEDFTISVTEVNQFPVLQSPGDQTVDEGQLLQFSAVATDSDLPPNTLTFSLGSAAPNGAQIDPDTGLFSWRPNEGQGGQSHTVQIRVTDSAGTSDTATFTVNVNEVDLAPVFADVETQFAGPGENLALQVRASDPDIPANAIRYSLEPGGPEDAAIDPVTGLLTWTIPNDAAFDLVEIGVRATEITDGEPGLSSVALVRVVPFTLNGLLLDSAIVSDLLQGSIGEDTLPASSTGNNTLLSNLAKDNSTSAGEFQFQFFSTNSAQPFSTGMFGTELEPLIGSSGYERFAEQPEKEGLEEGTGEGDFEPRRKLVPSKNDQSTRLDLPPELSDAVLEKMLDMAEESLDSEDETLETETEA